jgi:RNA polymerase sigma factor (sigma-70 family)
VPSKPSIDQLITQCKAADPKAQMALYDLYASAMYRVAFKIIGQTDEAEDAVQESMLSAFHSLDQFRGEVTFGAWLKKIVINKSIRLKQKQHRVLWKVPPEVFTTYQETSENIDDDQESDHIKSSVNRVELVLTKLPVQQAMIVKLYYYEGLEHAEIANYLNISEANSRTSLSRAKETMRKLLKL